MWFIALYKTSRARFVMYPEFPLEILVMYPKFEELQLQKTQQGRNTSNNVIINNGHNSYDIFNC